MSEEAALADLARSGISADDATRAGLSFTDNARKLALSMARAPALVLPYLDPITKLPMTYGAGKPFSRVRYLVEVTDRKGKVIRYGQPADSGCKAYFPPVVDWPTALSDVSWPIVITEGEKKSLALALQGVAAIGIGGVWNWRQDDELLPELAACAWDGRETILCYDSDAVTNSQVRVAELTLAAELQRRGAVVRICRLEPAEDGTKRGADDYVAAGQFNYLLKLLSDAERVSSVEQDVLKLNAKVAYLESEDCVYVIDDNRKISKAAFEKGSSFSSITTSIVSTVKGKPVERTVPLAPLWLKHPAARRYAATVFQPDTEAREIVSEGGTLLNSWRGLRATPGDVTPFLELTRHLLSRSDESVGEMVVNLLAYKAQHPEVKVPLATVLIGPQGCGKSMWAKLVGAAFGPYNQAIPSHALKSSFQPFIEASLIVVIDEAQAIHTIGAREHLRTLISDKRQELNKKYVGQQQIETFCQFILTSNDRRVGSYDKDDRRMIVVDCPERREGDFYDKVAQWERSDGPAHLMHWLLNYDLKGWEPPKHAPMTAEKYMAYMESLTPVQRLAEDMQTADFNIVKMWCDQATGWANVAANGGNPAEAKLAKEIMGAMGTIQMRPFYTPDELSLMFPAIVGQLHGNKNIQGTPSGEISRALRNQGVPYLVCADDPRGFRWRGRLAQFLIVADRAEWEIPITQNEFERLMKNFPTYREIAARALQKPKQPA